MAVSFQNGRLGIACYDCGSGELQLSESWEDQDLENLQLCTLFYFSHLPSETADSAEYNRCASWKSSVVLDRTIERRFEYDFIILTVQRTRHTK